MKTKKAIGRVAAIFGNKGEVTVNLYDIAEFNMGELLMVEIDRLVVPLFISMFKRKGQSGAVIIFDDIDTAARAEELLGKELFVWQNSVAPAAKRSDDDVYIEDLVGFSAVCNGQRGVITSFIDSDMNPLFYISIDDRDVLVPAVDEFIDEIDVNARLVTFTLPDGLMDL